LRRDPAAHVALDDPLGVAVLLDRLRRERASEQAAALAGRAAAHAALDDPGHAVRLLDSLWAVSAHEQAAALARDRAVHIPLDNQLGMADLLASLRGGRQIDRRPARRAAAE
jgi:hypothetical protein